MMLTMLKHKLNLSLAVMSISLLSACNAAGVTSTPSANNTTSAANGINTTTLSSEPSNFLIFATANTWYGDLQGLSGADNYCQADALCPNKETGGACKAIIVANNGENEKRIACSSSGVCGPGHNHDWVLYPNQGYQNNNGKFLGMTNAGAVFDAPMRTIFDKTAWSGFNSDWTTNNNRCGDWHVGKNGYNKGWYAAVVAGNNEQGSCSQYDAYSDWTYYCKEEYTTENKEQYCIKRHVYCAQVNECSASAAPGVKWSYCNKISLTLTSRDLSSAYLTEVNLTDSDLSGANLSSTILIKATLVNTILIDTNLTKADLSAANLANANLTNANLTKANLSDANLTNATLTNATLTKADLSDANLTNANLTNADLTGANLSDANFSGANLSGVIFTNAVATGAKFDNTIMPDGTLCSTTAENKCNLAMSYNYAVYVTDAYYNKVVVFKKNGPNYDGVLYRSTAVNSGVYPNSITLTPGSNTYAYVTNNGNGSSSGIGSISVYSTNKTFGDLSAVQTIEVSDKSERPLKLAISPKNDFAYLLSENYVSANGSTTCNGYYLETYKIDPANGKLTHQANSLRSYSGTCAVSITSDKTGRHVYIGRQKQGLTDNIQVFDIDNIGNPTEHGFYIGEYNLSMLSFGDYLYTTGAHYENGTSLGSKEYTYRINNDGSLEIANIVDGYGGRAPVNMVRTMNGDFIYTFNALDSSISMYANDVSTGSLTKLAPASVPSISLAGYAGPMAMVPMCNVLYIASPSSNTYTAFKPEGNGTLTLLSGTSGIPLSGVLGATSMAIKLINDL